MAKFHFRYQKVLEYREILEEFAKDVYLEARANRLVAEAELEEIGQRKIRALDSPLTTLEDRVALQRLMEKFDDDKRQQLLAIDILVGEEEAKRQEWVLKRQEHESLVKLYENDLGEWNLEQSRLEQAESDEWSIHRRKA